MDYLITVAFHDETIEIHHEGSLKEGLKAVWALSAKKKAQPFDIRFSKGGAVLGDNQDGWTTVCPIEPLA